MKKMTVKELLKEWKSRVLANAELMYLCEADTSYEDAYWDSLREEREIAEELHSRGVYSWG